MRRIPTAAGTWCRKFISPWREKLEVIPVKRYFPQRIYGIVKLKGRPLSPQARHFIEMLRETV
jgi:DNA-binding transcriptional LysR family regulator